MSDAAHQVHVSVHEPLLGTRVQLRIRAAAPELARIAEQRAVDEIIRLERVFSVYDPGSELCRWRAGDDSAAGPELVALLGRTIEWFAIGRGAFHPATAEVTARWRRAEAEGVEPAGDELAALAAPLGALPYALDHGRIVRRADSAGVDLNAVAKGHIVDAAAAAGAAVEGVTSVTVNAGGDLLHRGDGVVVVGIEDPHRPYDNAPPLTRVRLSNGGLATSGTARRGFRIAGQWYGHVIDPRRARPVAHIASASVLAPDAATADVAATIAGVQPVDEAIATIDGWPDVEALLVGHDGRLWRSAAWPS